MNQRIIYECEHCAKKRYLSKYKARDHESMCWYNPDVKACNTCSHNYYTEGSRECELGINTDAIPVTKCLEWKEKEEI